MKPLYLDWNLGLGDAILCNGLVRWLYEGRPLRDRIILPAYAHNIQSVAAMFSDLYYIQVVETKPDREACEILSIGINNPRWGAVQPFDRAFYQFAGVPFEAKWDSFHIPESGTEKPRPLSSPYRLAHHDPDRGFWIDMRKMPNDLATPIITVTKDTPRISDWRYMIRDAAEIHCIDSSVLHLAELLPTTGKLFYHRYARTSDKCPVDAVLRKPWKILD